MKLAIYILLAICPSFLHKAIRRKMGQRIGKGVKLKIGSLIVCNNVEIGTGSKIGPFSFIKSQDFRVGNDTVIKPLVIIKTLKIVISNCVHIAPLVVITSEFTKNSSLIIGDHSRIFPFCWLDTGEGITIGQHVGVGGHTLIFTHGVWSNFIEGGPISYGSVTIEDNVWLPWRVFILPNVIIGKNTIVGANSLISKSIEENSLAVGTPAKVIKKLEFDKSQKKERFLTVLDACSKYLESKLKRKYEFINNQLTFNGNKIVIDETENLNSKDLIIVLEHDFEEIKSKIDDNVSILDYSSLTIYLNGNKSKEILLFISFLRRYGVRLYIHK